MQFSPRQKELGHEVAEALRDYFTKHDLSGSALAYSGGLDSTVLAYLSGMKVRGYSVGTSNSRDAGNIEEGRKILGIDLVRIHADEIDLDRYISILKEVDPSISRRDIGFEMVLAIVLDNIEEGTLITGQGADELFYGYHRLAEDASLTNEWHMNKLIKETFPREKAIADFFGKRLTTPYLDSGIDRILLPAGRNDHFAGEVNKAILRCAALELGLPEELAKVKKTAAQYGSGIMKRLKPLPSWKELPESGMK